MRRVDANLELGLVPLSDPTNIHQYYHETEPTLAEKPRGSSQQHQPLTIFYKGRVCVTEVTEAQARTILTLASREMEENLMGMPSASSEPASSPDISSPAPTTIAAGQSIKRSLERFLQKRKNRTQLTGSRVN